MKWKKSEESDGAVCYERPGLLGGPGYQVDNAHLVTRGLNYSGSGEGAFGRARSWPVVTARVALPTGKDALAETLAKELRVFVDQFLERNGL